MKAIQAMCPSTATSVNSANGRVSRSYRQHSNKHNSAEMRMYLSKLKDLVPFMPKDRKLSKLEVIENVIYYICDLQNALEQQHPNKAQSLLNSFDVDAVLNTNHVDDDDDNDCKLVISEDDSKLVMNNSDFSDSDSSLSPVGCSQQRRPLGTLADNSSDLNSTIQIIPVPEKLSPSESQP